MVVCANPLLPAIDTKAKRNGAPEKREEDKKEVEANVLSNVKELVSPYLVRLKRGRLEPHQETMIEILQSNLNNIISPPSHPHQAGTQNKKINLRTHLLSYEE